ncbi:general secretion pathway protein GspL, partial [Acinetobacter sp. V2]
ADGGGAIGVVKIQ